MALKPMRIIIDTNNVVAKAAHVHSRLKNVEGLNTGGVFGALAMVISLVNNVPRPSDIIWVFDKGVPQFRKDAVSEIYKILGKEGGYKYKRKIDESKPLSKTDKAKKKHRALYIEAINELPKILKALGQTIAYAPDTEGDDCLGFLSKSKNYTSVLLSGDGDIPQLVRDNRVRVVKSSTAMDVDEHTQDERYNRMLFVKALKGDTSDSIPGIPGIGEVKAANLLKLIDKDWGKDGSLKKLKKVLKSHSDNPDSALLLKTWKIFKLTWKAMHLKYSHKNTGATIQIDRYAYNKKKTKKLCLVYGFNQFLDNYKSTLGKLNLGTRMLHEDDKRDHTDQCGLAHKKSGKIKGRRKSRGSSS